MMPKSGGPVVQSIVSLTSSLLVKMLTVLVSTVPKSQVFLLKYIYIQTSKFKQTTDLIGAVCSVSTLFVILSVHFGLIKGYSNRFGKILCEWRTNIFGNGN